MAAQETSRRWVCLDVGETIIDESRLWRIWAETLGVPALTFFAALGAALAARREPEAILDRFGRSSWRERAGEVAALYGGFRGEDLYPDALRALDGLRRAGYRIAVVGNQPAIRSAELRRLGIRPDTMAMSEELGVGKPDPAFFARTLELIGTPAPADVAYVGDRVDNDVIPARAAGMRAVWIRRGPWGVIQQDRDGAAQLVVDSLDELVRRIAGAWG